MQWLRDRRTAARLTYRELADLTGLHATTLQRVASGHTVPMLDRVLAYAWACEARGMKPTGCGCELGVNEHVPADPPGRPLPPPWWAISPN